MIKNDIERVIEPSLNELGYELWGCELLLQGKHSLLRVYIDKLGGIDITDCERASRQISAVLDVEDPIKTHYSLEVSSPGIPRPLFYKEQYQHYLGQQVAIKVNKKIDGNRKVSGIIQAVSDNAVRIGGDAGELELPFSEIVKAHLIGE